jgi:hypothetical protein
MSIEQLTDLYVVVDRMRREELAAATRASGATRTYIEGEIAGLSRVLHVLEDDFGVMPIRREAV